MINSERLRSYAFTATWVVLAALFFILNIRVEGWTTSASSSMQRNGERSVDMADLIFDNETDKSATAIKKYHGIRADDGRICPFGEHTHGTCKKVRYCNPIPWIIGVRSKPE